MKTFLAPALVVSLSALPLLAQAPSGIPDQSLPPPPVTYHGLIPGRTPAAEVRATLGPPIEEHSWYSWKLLYTAAGRTDHLDSVQFEGGKDGRLACIEAASIPPQLPTLEKARALLGEPEWLLELHRQSIADYGGKGLRLALDAAGNTIGAAYFPHGEPRVLAGERRFLSLRKLRQGPQPPPAAAAAPALDAGYARVDITPLHAEWVGPAVSGKRFQVHDPLYARCAVFGRGDLRIAIVGADLFGLMKTDVDPIEARLRAAGISHLVLAMAHNHTAPDSLGVYGHYPAEYVEHLKERIYQGVLEAARGLRPVASLRAASDELPLDGARVEGLFRNARNPGLVDPQIDAVQALDRDGKPIVTLVHFACHVEGLDSGRVEPTADFPGYLCDALDRDIGARAVFLNGAIGGMVSGDSKARTHEEARRTGERLAQEVERILKFAVEPAEARFSIERYPIEVPLTNVKFALLAKSTGRRPLPRGRIASELIYLRLGEAEVVTIPGELLPELSFEIQERMDGYPRMILGLVNDELGYILPGSEFTSGEYEEGMSVGPAIGPMVRDTAIRMIETARDPRRFRGR
jgi:hypothetical protein